MKNPQDRGKQLASVDLAQIDAIKLILETVPGKNTQCDWSYWSYLEAK